MQNTPLFSHFTERLVLLIILISIEKAVVVFIHSGAIFCSFCRPLMYLSTMYLVYANRVTTLLGKR